MAQASNLLEVPLALVQGGMAVRISTARLASAVSRAGGLGVIGASGMDEEELRAEIRETRSEARGAPFGVNIMVAVSRFKELIRVCVEERVPAILVGAGFSREVFEAREAGVRVIPIVSSVKAALISEKLGADAVVVESGRAGGHLGTLEPLERILGPILEKVRIPVIAAGGIESPDEAAAAVRAGAAGVQLGTRFALTDESNFARAAKDFLRAAREEDIVLIESPAGLPARAVRSPLLDRLASGKRPVPQVVKRCISCLRSCSKVFCLLDALVCAQRGDVEHGLFFTGDQLPRVRDVVPAAEVVRRYERALGHGLAI